MKKDFLLRDAADNNCVILRDRMDGFVYRETFYKRLPSTELGRRVKDAAGFPRYPHNVPIQRLRVAQFEIDPETQAVIREIWDTGWIENPVIWEADGRVTVLDIAYSWRMDV